MCKLLYLLSLCYLSFSAFAGFEEYFQRIEQVEQFFDKLDKDLEIARIRRIADFKPDESRLKVFSALALGDDADEGARKLVKAEGYQAPTTPDEEACLGLDVCVSLFGLDQAADPYLYWARQGKEAPRFKDIGEAHRAVWQDFSHRVRLADAPRRERTRQAEHIRTEQIRIQKEQAEKAQQEAEQTAASRQMVMAVILSTLGVLVVLFLLFRMVRSMRKGWSFTRWACFLVVLLLGVAVVGGDYDFLWKSYSLPYGYYTLLRLAVAGLSAWLACQAVIYKSHPLLILIGVLLTILYQPLVKITFEKETWCWINLATMPVLVILTATIDRREDEQGKQP